MTPPLFDTTNGLTYLPFSNEELAELLEHERGPVYVSFDGHSLRLSEPSTRAVFGELPVPLEEGLNE